jgi:hypothetical protein
MLELRQSSTSSARQLHEQQVSHRMHRQLRAESACTRIAYFAQCCAGRREVLATNI